MVRTLTLLLVAFPLLGQGPAEAWRTIETEHFRVHYPAEYEQWAMTAAARLEPIREAVAKEIGFTPRQRIDVLVVNPVAEPNGLAWPFLDTPRMIFYAEPPGPDEQLGAYGTWIDLLAVHETAHLVHMLRPSRNPLGRAFERFVLPLNPITLRAPRWVLEGYATVVEGRLTGAGRPTSTIRALILRRWAENGRLPSYGQLNSDRRFAGMSMAYLMGSAYLEWLERRAGPDSLRNLWSRLTARHKRSFDEAFTGVFGESPERLYGRFVAELTASAMAIDRAGPLQEGELFQETARASGDPAVSPDGSQIAVVLRERDKPQKLVIWSTGPATDEEKKFKERLDRIFARDPEDVPPVCGKPLPRKAVHTLVMADGGDIQTPRWTGDGKAIVFSHRAPDADGFLHFDLYRWDFERVTRITNLADVRDGDPHGDKAVAVRSRYGATQLVDVDLQTGAVTPRGEPSIERVIADPRMRKHLAYIAHEGASWVLHVDDRAIPLPGDAASPEWLNDDELVVTLFTRGFAELHRVTLNGESTQITRTSGGAFEAAPANDGRVFFMSLNPDGYVVRVLPTISAAPPLPTYDASLVPALPPPPTPLPAARGEGGRRPGEGHPYGLGTQEPSWFTATNFAQNQRSLEFGLRLGDVVGRLDTILVGAIAQHDAPDGFALASAWRGWPIEVQAHAFHTDDDTGVELRGKWDRQFPLSQLRIEAGALSSDDLAFANATFTTRQVLGTSTFSEVLRVDIDTDHYRATAASSYRSGSWRIAARYQLDRGERVTLGGLPATILPRSAYAHRILDPAIPVARLAGDEYDGWRIESTVPILPLTAFYQRHELDATGFSVAGLEGHVNLDANPILKTPGLDLTIGVARLLDEGDTNWWLGMRWRP